jgi:hypothetical protein
MCALEGAGVLQDRFKISGKGRCCYSSPRLALKLAVPGEFRALGPEGAGGHPGRAGRPGVELSRVLGGDGGGGHSGSAGMGSRIQRRVLSGEGAGGAPWGSTKGTG